RPPLLFEDGEQQRDFVSVRDVARAFHLAVDAAAVEGKVFNIGSGRAHTVNQVARLMAEALGRPQLEPVVTGKYRVGDVRHCFADIQAARDALGYCPSTALIDGVLDLAEWLAGQSPPPNDRTALAHAELAERGLTL